MSKKEFLHSTMKDINLRIENYREEKEYEAKTLEYQAWLTGAYVKSAINCFFSKTAKYPENPIETEKKSVKGIAKANKMTEEEIQQNLQYISMRVRQANANITAVKETKKNEMIDEPAE